MPWPARVNEITFYIRASCTANDFEKRKKKNQFEFHVNYRLYVAGNQQDVTRPSPFV